MSGECKNFYFLKKTFAKFVSDATDGIDAIWSGKFFHPTTPKSFLFFQGIFPKNHSTIENAFSRVSTVRCQLSQKKSSEFDYEVLELERKLLDTNKRIQNIVAAVSMGLVQESFITEMSKLEDDNIQMGIRLTELTQAIRS